MKKTCFFAVILAALFLASCNNSKQQSVMNQREPQKVLVVVDLQKDFINGTLPATNGADIIKPIQSIITGFGKVYFTLDWHPWNHCSFKANGGIWPQHCVSYTEGAALPDGILDNLDINNVRFLPKGENQAEEEYGQFSKTDAKNQDLFVKGDEVVVCGIAAEYCVLETLKNIKRLSNEVGFSLSVYMEGVACIENNDPLLEYINANGIKLYR